jgi:hypothetical protein
MAEYGAPIMDSMISQGLLEKNVFAFYMAMNGVDKSELIFGKIDDSKYSG